MFWCLDSPMASAVNQILTNGENDSLNVVRNLCSFHSTVVQFGTQDPGKQIVQKVWDFDVMSTYILGHGWPWH